METATLFPVVCSAPGSLAKMPLTECLLTAQLGLIAWILINYESEDRSISNPELKSFERYTIKSVQGSQKAFKFHEDDD